MEPSTAFTYRSARSGALTAGLALAVAVESLVLHLWLATRHPEWAWTLTALSVLSVAYLALEYRAWGTGSVRVTPATLDLRIAGRAALHVPRSTLASAVVASWRDLPDGPTEGRDRYVNLTGPAEPNVVLAFTAPVPVRLAAGLLTRRAGRVGLHLDDPAGFVAAVTAAPAGVARP